MTVTVDIDSALVRRMRSGDATAVADAYDRYAGIALAVAVRVVGDRGIAEDVVHDAFLAMWQRIDQFEAARGNLRSWLLTIVRHRAIDRVRARRPQMDVEEADELALLRTGVAATADAAVANIAATEVRAAVARLPADQRVAVELAYFGGHTYREIAVITGVPPGTASGRLRLALRKLRETLLLTDAGPAEIGERSRS